MTSRFSTNFTSATDPELTPNPFDVITEGAGGNDAKYSATGGIGSSPAMELVLGGTTSVCHGERVLSPVVVVLNKVIIIDFALKIVDQGLLATQIIDVLQFRLAGVNVASARIKCQALPTEYKVVIRDLVGTGGAVDGTSLFTQGVAYHQWHVEYDGITNEIRLRVDGTLEATTVIGGAISNLDSIRFGTVSGATPLATASYFYDQLSIEDGDDDSSPPITAQAFQANLFIDDSWLGVERMT